MRLSRRNLTIPHLKSFDDIIEFYKINFDINITLNDIKERTYLFSLVFSYSKSSFNFFPNNEDYEKIIFYDRDFLIRLANIHDQRIEEVIANKIFISSNDDYGLFFKYLLNIDISILHHRQIEFSSFDSMVDQTFNNKREMNNSVDFSLTDGKVKFPQSLRTLKTTNASIVGLNSLQCLELIEMKSQYLDNLHTLTNLIVLKVLRPMTRLDFSQFKSLKILISCSTMEKITFPDGLKVIYADIIKNCELPNSLELLSCFFYQGDKNLPNLKFFSTFNQYTSYNLMLPSPLIYLKERYLKNIDLKDFPDLVYLNTKKKEVKNLREDVMISY